MHQILQDILRQHRISAYPDPSWYVWASNQLVQCLSGGEHPPQDDLQRAQLLTTAVRFMRQGVVFSPYDRGLLAMLFKLHALSGLPNTQLAWHRWADAQLDGLQLCPQSQALEAVEGVRNKPGAVIRLLAQQPPVNVFYLLLMELWRLGEKDALLEHIRRFRALSHTAPVAPVLAVAAWHAGDLDLSQELLGMSPPHFLSHLLQAELALAADDRDAAQAHWRLSLKAEPLQPSLVYRMQQSAMAAPDPNLVRKAKVHVAFYTFNKLHMTLDTLKSLLRSNIGEATVSLLNNGSTAFSPQELEAGVDAIRQGRPVNLIHLPTNIGAPAARNWLRRLPETSAADYLAYLDDDVFLPANWLEHYLQDLKSAPKAVVAGPLCLNPGPLRTIQYIWRFFEEVGDHHIRFSNNCPQFMDIGQYASRRVCLSVMGCCHLFDMRRVNGLAIPDFDIRFSPSQVDDLEHDMQIWKAGGQVLYDGRVRVVHRQDAGKQSPLSAAAWGNVLANHRKMEAKWSAGELDTVHRKVTEADDAWYRASLDAVRPMLPENAKSVLELYAFRSV